MAKPNTRNIASPAPQAGKKDPKPIFIKPRHVMPVGASQACRFKFPPPAPPRLCVISAK